MSTHIQPFHTYHEYLQGMQLIQKLRIKNKRVGLSDSDMKEWEQLEQRAQTSTPIYEKYNKQDL